MVDNIKKFIKNEEIVTNLLYGVLGLIPFIIFLVYVLFFSDFSFSNSISQKTIGFLTVITLIGLRIYRYIAIKLGKKNGIKANGRLQELEEKIDNIEFELNDDTYGVVAINEINDEKQNNRNIVLTQKKIGELEKKKRKYKKKSNDQEVKKIEKEIEYLRKNELFDDSYVPFDYYVFENTKSSIHSKPIDGSNVHKKIEDGGKLTSWIINIATSLLSGVVGLGIAIGLSFWVIIGALVSLILSIGITFLINYSMTYIKVNTQMYYKKRKNIYQIKQSLYNRVKELKKVHVDSTVTNEVKPTPTIEEFAISNSVEEENALERKI